MRIAIVHKDLCHSRKCGTECILYCPRVRTGDETVLLDEQGKAVISEELCVGCGICVKMMPEVYELIDQKAYARLENVNSGNMTMIHKTVSKCPTQAITINVSGGTE